MNYDPHPDTSVSRRRILGALGVGAATSLAGCQTSLFGDEDSGPDSVEGVRLAELPDSYSNSNDRLAIPSDDLAGTFNLKHKQQLRISRDGQPQVGDFHSALYTVRTDAEFSDTADNTIWLSPGGLNRINTTAGWLVSVKPEVPHPELSTREEGKRNSEYVEQVINARGSNIVACAPNGGDIISGTDKQALRVASEMEATAWTCSGYNEGGGARDRWYIEPENHHPVSYPGLAELVNYDPQYAEGDHDYSQTYRRAIVFTDTDEVRNTITIGGLVRDEVKSRVRDVLRKHLNQAGADVAVVIAREGDAAATDPSHIANRLTNDGHRGLQIGQTESVRENYWLEVADAVIEAFSEE